jgi:ligand-binding SRPBCC domain-containing protein
VTTAGRQPTLPRRRPSFRHRFIVRAPVADVAAFHEGPDALRTLQPPFSCTRFERVDPLAEGSVTEFTMGPPPFRVRWRAVHRDVVPGRAFSDVQEAGPMRRWVHRHNYRETADGATEVIDRIWYRHPGGLRGIATRLLINPLTLRLLFAYRAFATRRAVARLRAE